MYINVMFNGVDCSKGKHGVHDYVQEFEKLSLECVVDENDNLKLRHFLVGPDVKEKVEAHQILVLRKLVPWLLLIKSSVKRRLLGVIFGLLLTI